MSHASKLVGKRLGHICQQQHSRQTPKMTENKLIVAVNYLLIQIGPDFDPI
jgi:hypothetical protein